MKNLTRSIFICKYEIFYNYFNMIILIIYVSFIYFVHIFAFFDITEIDINFFFYISQKKIYILKKYILYIR